MDYPVLQPHQLMLEAEKLPEVEAPVELLALGMLFHIGEHRLQAALVDLHLEFFVEAVGEFLPDASQLRRFKR